MPASKRTIPTDRASGNTAGAMALASEAHAALHAAGDIAYEWNLGSDRIRWAAANPQFDAVGGPLKLASGKALLNRLHPEDRRLRQHRLKAHLDLAETFDCEFRIRRAGGGFAWVHERGAAMPIEAREETILRGVWRFVTARKEEERRLEQLGHHDALTGLYNRKRLRESLDFIAGASRRSSRPGAYFVIGIDKLAGINDAFGAEAGDAAIREVARRLEQCSRASDVLGRIDSDRFGVVLAECPEDNLAIASERIRAAVHREPIDTPSGSFFATVSIGGATFPEPAQVTQEIMSHADTALADAKRAGGDCFVSYRVTEEERRRQRRGMAIGEEVQRALKENRLVFAYQPVVRSTTNRNSYAVDYYECLLRMMAPDGNVIAAADFIPEIERLGFVRAIDRYVLERAVSEVEANPGIRLGFNISGLTTTDRSWLRTITHLLRDRGELASQLVIEITETAALLDLDECARFVDTLRALGCRVAIDDFGTGFTSFRHLQALAVDTVKIDGSFVHDLGSKAENHVFLRHLIGLAHGLGLATVAEGVEEPGEAAVLEREGVTFLQGYYFARPTIHPPWLAATARRSR